MIATPIFLIGAERSGTTLLRLMLDSHPQIAFHNEFEYAVDLLKDDESASGLALNDYYEYLSTHRIFMQSNFEVKQNLSYPELVNDFLLQKQQRSHHKCIVGATVHYQFQRLTRIWPQAKFIHLFRDGRDVAKSTIDMGWAGNMFTGVESWIVAEKTWENFCQQLSVEQHISVKYEDLILNSEQVLTQICQFIGVPFDKAIYSYVDHSHYSLPDSRLIGQWRKLSIREIQLAESRITAMLEDRGYPLSGFAPLTMTTSLCWRIKMQNRWAIICFRFKRYPLKLYLSDIFSRRFGTKLMRKQIKIKMNEYDRRFLK